MSIQNRRALIALRSTLHGAGHRRRWRACALGAALAGALALSGSAAAQTPQFLYAFGSAGDGLGKFDRPFGVAVDGAGRIVVADTGNNRIEICDVSDPGNVTCQAFGSQGSDLGQFSNPFGVAANGAGRVVVTDFLNARIQICDPSNLSQVNCQAFGDLGSGLGQFKPPFGVAIDGADKIVVSEGGFTVIFGPSNERIQICDLSDLSNGNVTCQAFGSPGSNPGQFNSASGVAVDGAGNIVVADAGNNRIQICDVSDLSHNNVTCQAFGSQGGDLGQFNLPIGVAVDGAGNIVVADAGNNRIQICDVSDLSHNNVTCQAFGSQGSDPGQFNGPLGVAVDSAGDIVVADTGNNRVEVFGEPDSDGDGVRDTEDACPTSDLSATVVIDGCDSGVANALDATGCSISDLVAGIAAGASNHGGFTSGVAHLLNDLKKSGVITGGDKGAIQRCAAQADLP